MMRIPPINESDELRNSLSSTEYDSFTSSLFLGTYLSGKPVPNPQNVLVQKINYKLGIHYTVKKVNDFPFPSRESLVSSYIPTGDGKIANPVLQCRDKLLCGPPRGVLRPLSRWRRRDARRLRQQLRRTRSAATGHPAGGPQTWRPRDGRTWTAAGPAYSGCRMERRAALRAAPQRPAAAPS
jgi:hypothetical protein